MRKNLYFVVPKKSSGITPQIPFRFVHAGLAKQIIEIGFRTIATYLHPNAGGDRKSMIALSEAKDWLTKQLR